ncbi:MAG: AAA family ATPase [Solirubrobacteraceae bacterium]
MEGEPGTRFEDQVLIDRVRYVAPDTGFGVVEANRFRAKRGWCDEVILVGLIGHLEAGERVAVAGVWQDDRRFGLQVKVEAAQPLAPAGPKALILYLERVKHIGPARAAKLFQAHGEAVLDAVDADPRGTFKAAGLNARQATEAARAWDNLRSTRALHLLLAPHGLAWLVPRIDKQYGPSAHRVVREQPYELTSVFGVGFATADTIAGAPREDPARAEAALVHVLAEAERDGSTCLPVEEALRRTRALIGTDPALTDRVVVEDGFAYRPPIAALEAELARRVAGLLAAEPAHDAAGEIDTELTPAPEQAAAVANAFAHRLSIVTGGPGTGKTATIQLICAAARAQDASILLVAPTGRAARRIAESSGVEASTVHSALGWVPGDGPQRTEEDPLQTDLLVVDETSMANLELLVTLLRAVGDRTHVVLVGDADQLAPVGAGKPFAELVASGLVPKAELTHIFRQAAGSMIVRGAHAVRGGRVPSFAAEDGLERDLFLIERADPVAALEEIVSLVATRLPAHYGVDPLNDVQVFAPVYRGPLGIDALNTRLRDTLNPGGAPVLGGRLRVGDKLMLSGRNLHDLGLMNGTVLRLLGVREDLITVEADGVTVDLPEEEAGGLRLAYACSVHKGQGIELPVAVLVAHPGAGAFFLRREMLYTAMTRARKATVIVGLREVVAAAAARADTSGRHSRLADRLTAPGATADPRPPG